MIGISFFRVLRSAWQNFWRNIWLALATLMIMVITLLMTSFLFFVNVIGVEALGIVESKVDLLVTLRPDASDEEVGALANEIRARHDVEEVTIISSEEALADFMENNQSNPVIEESLKELGDNPLFASLSILANEPRFYPDIARQLEAERYSSIVEEIKIEDLRPVADKLATIISTLKQVGVVVTGAFAVLAVLIMFNTVRLAIYSFREEIDIMRLVGASNWFIRGPFVIESVIVSLLAVLVSTVIVYIVLNAIALPLQQFFSDQGQNQFNIYHYAIDNWPQVIGIQTALGVGLAVISSWIGIRRYLSN